MLYLALAALLLLAFFASLVFSSHHTNAYAARQGVNPRNPGENVNIPTNPPKYAVDTVRQQSKLIKLEDVKGS